MSPRRSALLVRWWQTALCVVAIAFSRPAGGRLPSAEGVGVVASAIAGAIVPGSTVPSSVARIAPSWAVPSAIGPDAVRWHGQAGLRVSRGAPEGAQAAATCPSFAEACRGGAAFLAAIAVAELHTAPRWASGSGDGDADANAARCATTPDAHPGPHASQVYLRTSRILC